MDKTINEITSFQNKVKDFTVDELEQLQIELNGKLTHMVFDNYLVQKIALVQSLLNEKKGTN